jgi:hypothetical protein
MKVLHFITMLLLIQPISANAVTWTKVETGKVHAINVDLKSGVPTADVAIYYPSNLDAQFANALPVDELIEQFILAKHVFLQAGVQLNLLWIKKGVVDPSHLSILANDIPSLMPDNNLTNMYVNGRRHPSYLSQGALRAFESIIEKDVHGDRTLHVVVLQKVFMSFHEKIDERSWRVRTIHTGGLSFPSYSYAEIPRHLRGVITISRADPAKKVMAHEIGHKIINVSHEYKGTDPQHEVRADGGLMLYGSGLDIPSGPEGRWHRERLHASPYIYTRSGNGDRVWNHDYKEGGHYYDPIYGDKVIHFEPKASDDSK